MTYVQLLGFGIEKMLKIPFYFVLVFKLYILQAISGNQTAKDLANTVGEVEALNQTKLIFATCGMALPCRKYILPLNKPLLMTQVSNLLRCCKIPHLLWLFQKAALSLLRLFDSK